MEYETDDSNKNWVERVKESPRTVSALIIILIVAAAIYAFSGDNTTKEEAGEPVAQEESQTEEVAATPAPEAGTTTPAVTPVTKEQIAAAVETLPEARKTDTAYVEVAQKGDGITHMARRATSRYLNENTVDFAVTNEHRIYIEDYIKDHLQRTPTHIGTEREISFDLISDAVASAKTLNDKQLHNLTKYTSALK